MNNLYFKQPKIKITDTVARKGGTIKEPPASIECRYLEELTPQQKTMLYTVISINPEEETCCIEPHDKNKMTWETFPIDHLILIKAEKPKIHADAFKMPNLMP